jgi:hypothetical protein
LLASKEVLDAADCLVVVAGMDGALPSAVGGLTGVPLVAVPTSVGYGASFGGVAALLTMLNSCAPGVVVVNIDNGFGAGLFAARGGAEDRPVIGWLDCAAGASGDMLLGALVDAGVPVETLQGAVDAVAPEPVELRVSTVERHGIGAVKVDVHTAESGSRRTWGEVRTLLDALPEPIRITALDAFAGWPAPRRRCIGSIPRTSTSTRSARSTRSPTWSASPPVCTRSACNGWPRAR